MDANLQNKNMKIILENTIKINRRLINYEEFKIDYKYDLDNGEKWLENKLKIIKLKGAIRI